MRLFVLSYDISARASLKYHIDYHRGLRRMEICHSLPSYPILC